MLLSNRYLFRTIITFLNDYDILVRYHLRAYHGYIVNHL